MVTNQEALFELEEGIERSLSWLKTLELNKERFSPEEYRAWRAQENKSIEIYSGIRERINNGTFNLKSMETKSTATTETATEFKPIEGAVQLDFSTNWNEKLNCKFFTTLRLLNTEKYFYGQKFNVFLKGKFLKSVEVESVRAITIEDINIFVSGLDTGYSVKETQDILRKMYWKCDWSVQKLHFVLLKTLKPEVQ